MGVSRRPLRHGPPPDLIRGFIPAINALFPVLRSASRPK